VKKKKATKPKKIRVARTRGSATYTEAAFWGMIKACLRRASRWWKPSSEVKMAARRAYKGPNKRLKWEYKCNICKNYFPEKSVQVDHIVPVGSLNKADDLPGMVERLFCEKEGLQVVCAKCHTAKSLVDNALIKENKKKTV